jgi:hypothetical protein
MRVDQPIASHREKIELEHASMILPGAIYEIVMPSLIHSVQGTPRVILHSKEVSTMECASPTFQDPVEKSCS